MFSIHIFSLSRGFDMFDRICRFVLHLLKTRDLRNLRRTSRSLRALVDDKITSQRVLRTLVSAASNRLDPVAASRYLLRSLFVPSALCQTLPVEHYESLIRPAYPDPSAWTISVMTMVSYLSTPVDLRSVFHCVDVVDFDDINFEQTNDLKHCKDESSCDRVLQRKANGSYGPHQSCIDDECACLAAFFPGILDIHFRNFCRGDPEFAEVKAKKRGRPPLRTFENQCTMRICMSRTSNGCQQKNGQLWNIINLKMFQNGKIQMTGCKSLEQARGAVQFLLRKLMDKAPAMRAKRDCMTQLRCFSTIWLGGDANRVTTPTEVLTAIRESATHHDLPLRILNKDALRCVLLQVDNESLFACRRVDQQFRCIVESCDFWKTKTEQELRSICERSERGWFLTHKYNGRFHRMERVKNAEHFEHPRLLYCRYSTRGLRRHRPFLVAEQYENLHVAGEQVAMINSDFRTNFELNLPVLFKILYQEHRQSTQEHLIQEQATAERRGRILQCSYSPDDYVALNVKYESPIMPDPIPDADEPNETKTVISFFIFRTGSVIINSARSIAQEVEAYNFINSIFKTHYARIWNVETSKPKKRRKNTEPRRKNVGM